MGIDFSVLQPAESTGVGAGFVISVIASYFCARYLDFGRTYGVDFADVLW
jgi:hypothetical protein